jgi:hypothetical protein
MHVKGYAVMIRLMMLAAQLYCWQPSDYGTPSPPTCALTYEQCQRLVSDHGGSCRSM